jgi:nicotinamide mononucleotide adenylyltransferase
MAESATKCDENIRKFYFFVGRATPPHSGHIQVIQETIKLARTGRTCALILLGDGPQGGLRTSSNPIEHDTKAEFIRHKLSLLKYSEDSHYIIQKMSSASQQVVDFVRGRIPQDVEEISISQVAGDKDDDARKLRWIRDNSIEQLKREFPSIRVVDGGVIPIKPVTSGDNTDTMSATKVRNKAVECYNKERNDTDSQFSCWTEAFPFYSEGTGTAELSKKLFAQIIKHKETTLARKSTPLSTRSKSSVRPSISKSLKSPKSTPLAKRMPKGGSRQKHTRRRRSSRLRNKKTLCNIRRRK